MSSAQNISVRHAYINEEEKTSSFAIVLIIWVLSP